MVRCKVSFAEMSSKETPKKVYRTGKSNIAVSSCRLCSAVGDAIHCKNIFKPLNRHLLKIAEQLCGHPIVFEKSLPHLVCRPCERRLKNTIEFQKVLRESEQKFQRQLSQTRSKRCIDISPSVSQPPIKSRLATSTEDETGRARTTARAALSFQSCVEVNTPLNFLSIGMIRVTKSRKDLTCVKILATLYHTYLYTFIHM